MATHELTPARFVEKWKAVELSERAASQEHFIDLCRLLGQPTPADHDATGAEYAFEKGVAVTDGASKGAKGEYGYADAWWRSKFAWEYKRKGKYKDLGEAYRQLCQYREALENPPLLVVCDIARTEIHTNFTGTAKCVHVVALDEINTTDGLDKLRRVFTDPQSFRPTQTAEHITRDVAEKFARLSQRLEGRSVDPHAAAHFLMKCMFCLFAEDIDLLPGHMFKQILQSTHQQPERFTKYVTELFAAMRTGGECLLKQVPWFNGGLFDDAPPLELTKDDLGVMLLAAGLDWSSVEPAIFGTLFERSLDPAKRAQIGAHYTSREDILLVVEPVVMAPLRRSWQDVQTKVEEQLARRRTAKTAKVKASADNAINTLLQDFLQHLGSVRILDPACGSGNFLYVAIQQLLNLEKEVITYAARPEIGQGLLPRVRPTQLHGIEINPYAAELAQVVIWIGYLQWMRDNGFVVPRDPILAPLQTIENRDAILAWVDEKGCSIPAWREGAKCVGPAAWPEADYIIGNPPFLGSKVFRQNGLPDAYIDAIHDAFSLPGTSDLCCYWFDLACHSLEVSPNARVGLLATQGIRGRDNRAVLDRICSAGQIFSAWSDKNWILDGAAVHVSIIAFDAGGETRHTLNGEKVPPPINPDLTSGTALTTALPLLGNCAVKWSVGTQKTGDFDIDVPTARVLLSKPGPSHGSVLNVIKPWLNGLDVMRRAAGKWIIDFDQRELTEAALYEAPFEYVVAHVKPFRDEARNQTNKVRWWIHERPRPELRSVIGGHTRYMATPRVAKHRLFVWLSGATLPDCQLIVFGRSDDYLMGMLHSSIHELWVRRMGTQLREAESGFRYTPTTCFETFALPWSPGHEDTNHEAYQRISAATKELIDLRERWLNPPEWIEPIAKAIDAADTFEDVPEQARALIRQSAIMAAAAKDPRLKKRTLTNLYNERPTWLKLAHEKLDRAVLAAYAAVDPEGGWSEDWAEVWRETGAGQALPAGHELAARRAEVDQRVLGNLLRLNQLRAEVDRTQARPRI